MSISKTKDCKKKRKRKTWWAVDGPRVVHVSGYSCEPENPKYWWCPAVGASLSERHHLFETENDALKKAIQNAEMGIEKLTEIAERLRKRCRKSGILPRK